MTPALVALAREAASIPGFPRLAGMTLLPLDPDTGEPEDSRWELEEDGQPLGPRTWIPDLSDRETVALLEDALGADLITWDARPGIQMLCASWMEGNPAGVPMRPKNDGMRSEWAEHEHRGAAAVLIAKALGRWPGLRP